MSMKKNLTIAGLAALLAVPAFNGAINANASNIQFGDGAPGNAYSRAAMSGNNGWHSFDRNGHHFTVQGQGGSAEITAVDGNSNATNAQVEAAFNGQNAQTNEGNDSPVTQSNTNQTQPNSNQYNGSSLPQTSEVHATKKVMAAASALVAIGMGAAALDLINKYQKRGTAAHAFAYGVPLNSGNNKDDKVIDDINRNLAIFRRNNPGYE